MKYECYRILSDGAWHGCKDFVHLGLSYRNRLNELKKEGEQSGNFIIESRKDGRRPTFEYRMLKVVKEPALPKKSESTGNPGKNEAQGALFDLPPPVKPKDLQTYAH